METYVADRRETKRLSVPRETSEIELRHPGPAGPVRSLPLLEVSAAGCSFRADPEQFPGLTTGSSISAVVLRVGDLELRGDLLVMHTSGTVCGALFYPQDDEDLFKLKGLVAGLTAGLTVSEG